MQWNIIQKDKCLPEFQRSLSAISSCPPYSLLNVHWFSPGHRVLSFNLHWMLVKLMSLTCLAWVTSSQISPSAFITVIILLSVVSSCQIHKIYFVEWMGKTCRFHIKGRNGKRNNRFIQGSGTWRMTDKEFGSFYSKCCCIQCCFFLSWALFDRSQEKQFRMTSMEQKHGHLIVDVF